MVAVLVRDDVRLGERRRRAAVLRAPARRRSPGPGRRSCPPGSRRARSADVAGPQPVSKESVKSVVCAFLVLLAKVGQLGRPVGLDAVDVADDAAVLARVGVGAGAALLLQGRADRPVLDARRGRSRAQAAREVGKGDDHDHEHDDAADPTADRDAQTAPPPPPPPVGKLKLGRRRPPPPAPRMSRTCPGSSWASGLKVIAPQSTSRSATSASSPSQRDIAAASSPLGPGSVLLI